MSDFISAEEVVMLKSTRGSSKHTAAAKQDVLTAVNLLHDNPDELGIRRPVPTVILDQIEAKRYDDADKATKATQTVLYRPLLDAEIHKDFAVRIEQDCVLDDHGNAVFPDEDITYVLIRR